jgi:hypothetical protein
MKSFNGSYHLYIALVPLARMSEYVFLCIGNANTTKQCIREHTIAAYSLLLIFFFFLALPAVVSDDGAIPEEIKAEKPVWHSVPK